jgi:hypothetical protein
MSKRKNFLKIIKLFLLPALITVLALFAVLSTDRDSLVFAQDKAYTKRDEVPYDANLSDQESNVYGSYDTIAVVRLSPPKGIGYGNSEDWIKGFYYYSITKMGFADIPFHYIVSWDGSVYEGKGGGQGVQLSINLEESDISSNVLLVGYFDNNRELTNSGDEQMLEILSELLGRYDLENEAIVPAEFQISRKEENSLAALILKQSEEGYWEDVVSRQISRVSPKQYSREFEGSIENVNYAAEVEAGQNFVVTLQVKNNSDFPWYNSGEHRIMVATSDPRNHESDFFVTDKWASFTKVDTMKEQWVLPQEIANFEFELATPLLPGEYSETFEAVSLPDDWIKGTQFTVDFTVSSAGLDLVEIRDTETGSLNVRDCPSTGCNQIGQVVPGDILVKIGTDGNWYQVQFGGGKEGWVYGKYVEDI